MTGNGVKSSVFTKDAGPAGDGWYFTCGCQDATDRAGGEGLRRGVQGEVQQRPVDVLAGGLRRREPVIEAIKAQGQRARSTRRAVLDAVNETDYKGITAQIKFEENGENRATEPT